MRARDRLANRGLTARALAARIGRSERCVYEVLGCVQPGRPTLALIEAELDRLAAEAPLLASPSPAGVDTLSGDGHE